MIIIIILNLIKNTMKHTKQERNAIYREAKKQILNRETDFICIAVECALVVIGYNLYYDIVNITDYPEIEKHRPDDACVSWFEDNEEGRQKRLNILDQAIKETE